MVIAYSIILAVSSWLAAYALLAVAKRLQRLLGTRSPVLPAGYVALAASLVFLLVVAAPAPVIAATGMLALAQLFAYRRPWSLLTKIIIYILCALLVSSSVALPALGALSPAFMLALAAAALVALMVAAEYLPEATAPTSLGLMATLLPLAAAPFVVATPGFIALDVALIGAALLGAFMASGRATSFGGGASPLVLLAGWLMLVTAAHGGWVSACISLLVYGGAIAYALTQSTDDGAHAF